MFKKVLYFSCLLKISLYSSISFAQAAPSNVIPSAEDFALPEDRSFSISDDGKKVAFLSGDESDSKLIVIDIEEMNEIPLSLGDKTKPRSVSWADSDHLLITVSFSYNDDIGSKSNNYKYEMYRTLSYSLSTKKNAVIMPIPDLESNTGFPIKYIDRQKKRVILTGVTSDVKDRGFVVIGQDDKINWKLGAYYSNIDTGKGAELAVGNEITDDYIFDKNGNPRLRIDIDAKSRKVHLYKLLGRKAVDFLSWNDAIDIPFSIEGFLDNDSLLILESDDETTKLLKLNIETGGKTEFLPGEKRNISNVIVDPYTKEPIGIVFDGIENNIKWLDETLEKKQAQLNKTFQGKMVDIDDWDEKREKLLISVSSGNEKTHTYLFDTKTNQAGDLSMFPDSIANYQFAPKNYEKFKASDGLEIPVYITRPKNTKGKKMPALLLPHGGPKAHDDANFDYISQFLASLGYIVIQPQFRGSTGYGKSFSDAGYGEWAGKMQTDTIEALGYAISKGDIDKDRVCIVGASYGGYSALVGAAQDADKFKCAISYGGVFDLAAFQFEKENRSGSIAYWREHMGATRYDTVKIHSISPLYMVDKIKSPVLLMHGTDDTVVMPEQSQKMYNALKKAGKEVKYIELKDEDHWLSREKTRAQFLKEMENFLAPILKPQE